ncbi:portal protein, partial [Escherichia coli]
ISPQEQLNKLSSQELHIINTTANSGWQVEENSLVSPSADELQARGAETGLVIVRRRGTAALEKIQPNQIPSGIVHAADRAATNMMYISNVNEGALGHTGVNIAGKTVQEKKASMLASLQIIMDNYKFTET